MKQRYKKNSEIRKRGVGHGDDEMSANCKHLSSFSQFVSYARVRVSPPLRGLRGRFLFLLSFSFILFFLLLLKFVLMTVLTAVLEMKNRLSE